MLRFAQGMAKPEDSDDAATRAKQAVQHPYDRAEKQEKNSVFALLLHDFTPLKRNLKRLKKVLVFSSNECYTINWIISRKPCR
jgi:hypothetical protein